MQFMTKYNVDVLDKDNGKKVFWAGIQKAS